MHGVAERLPAMPPAFTILANSEVRDEFLAAAAAMLRAGASALDAAEQVARQVEDDPDEHSVGYSGWPNLLGEVELDASIMDGTTRRAGAVGALTGFAHPVSVARAVMERLPHLLLVGAGAARFAGEIGADRREMLSPEAREKWLARLREWQLWPDDLDPALPAARLRQELDARLPGLTTIMRRVLGQGDGHDTMNVLVRDSAGRLAVAVTTSGVPWKHPGRCGDSPIIGAGNYADDRHGAAACLGWGEVAIRAGAARLAVAFLQAGHPFAEAGAAVARDLRSLCTGDQSVRLLLMDAAGHAAAFATHPGFACKVLTADDPAPRLLEAAVPDP